MLNSNGDNRTDLYSQSEELLVQETTTANPTPPRFLGRRLLAVIVVVTILFSVVGCSFFVGPEPGDGAGGDDTTDTDDTNGGDTGDTTGDDSTDGGGGDDTADTDDTPETSFLPFTEEASPELGLVSGRYYYDLAADPDATFDAWYDIGVRWIRIEFETFWDHRPGGGVADSWDDPIVTEKTSVYQTIIEEAHRRHIKVLGLIAWNSIPGGPNSIAWEGDDLAQSTVDAYVDSVARHLETFNVDAVEIWNEPWGYFFGGSDGARLDQYSRLLIETYTEVKPSHTDIPFLGAVTVNAEPGEWLGHHGWDTTYEFRPEDSIFNNTLIRTYRDEHAGALPLDALSWHPYGSGTWPDPDEAFYFGRDFDTYFDIITGGSSIYLAGAEGDQVWFRDVDGRDIVGDYPIWFSEYGWQSTTESAEDLHADRFAAMVAAIRRYPQIEVATLYTYQDDEDTADGEGNSFGIIRDSDEGYARKAPFYEFAAQATGVGVDAEGTVDRAFVRAYVDEGGKVTLGEPVGDMVDDGDGAYQDFSGGEAGDVRLLVGADGAATVEDR